MTGGKPELLELKLSELEQSDNLRQVAVDDALRELAASIEQHGILEPVLVRRLRPSGFSLVAGYRRCAAAKLAKLLVVPAIVTLEKAGTGEIRSAQLVENIQREDVNPLDQAKALQQILEVDGISQVDLGKRLGKSQPWVANRLRLLELPEQGQQLLTAGKLSIGAAQEILRLPAEASREAKRVLARAEDRANAGEPIAASSLKWEVDSAKRTFQERQQRERKKAAAKFPACPVKGCGKTGSPVPEWHGSDNFRCSAGHEWSPKTGKVAHKEGGSTRVGYTPPPTPKLPLVNGLIKTSVSQDQVCRRILESAKKVAGIRLRWVSGAKAELTVDVELSQLKGAQVPNFEFDTGRDTVVLETAESWMQRDDVGRKRAAQDLANLQAWLGTFGRPKKVSA